MTINTTLDKVLYTNAINLNGGWLTAPTIRDLLEAEFEIPKSQREFVWTSNQISLLLDSINRGYPIPAIVIAVYNGDAYLTDGRQRITSLLELDRRFRDQMDICSVENLPRLAEQYQTFCDYHIPVITTECDTEEELNAIFERHNSGAKMTTAQKAKANYAPSMLLLLEQVRKHKLFSLLAKDAKKTNSSIGEIVTENVRSGDDKVQNIVYAHLCKTTACALSSNMTTALKSIALTPDEAQKEGEKITERLDVMVPIFSELQEKTHKKALAQLSNAGNLMALYMATEIITDSDKYYNGIHFCFELGGDKPSGKPQAILFKSNYIKYTFSKLFGAGVKADAETLQLRCKGICISADRAEKLQNENDEQTEELENTEGD